MTLLVSHLGITHVLVGSAGMSIEHALHWHGIHDWYKLESFQGCELESNQKIHPGLHVVVISCAETIAFELALLTIPDPSIVDLTGYGPAQPETLRLPENWLGQDLWHVDQIIRNHLLTSLAVADFPFFTVWVPTFADAILELWPCAVEPQLRHWSSTPDSMIFAILLETWGWNLVAFQLTQKQLTTLF